MEFHIIEGVVLAKGKGLYELDGVRVQLDGELIVERVPATVNFVTEEKLYFYNNGTERLNAQEFRAKRDTLDKTDEDGVWYTVEDRNRYNDFVASYKTEYEDAEWLVPVDFKVYHYGPSPDPLIKSLRMCGELKPLYRYTTNWQEVWRRLMVKYGYVEGTGKGRFVELPTHSRDTGEFIKINGTYTKFHRGMKSIVAGTLEECVDALNDDIAFIEQMFTLSEASLTGGNLDPMKIVGLLQGVYAGVFELSVNKSSKSDRYALLNRIKDYITAITKSDEYKCNV